MNLFKKKNDIENMDFEQEAKPRKKKTGAFKWILSVSLFIVVGLVLIGVFLGLTHPYFRVEEIDIQGNRSIEDSEIEKASGITKQENIFKLDINKVARGIKELKDISSVEVTKLIPNKIQIKVTETSDFAYIKVDEGYLIVRGDLTIDRLEKNLNDTDKNKLIRLSNAGYKELALGNKATEKETEKEFLTVLKNHSELADVTKEIDFGTGDNGIIFRVNQETNINFGKAEDLDYKFTLVEKIMLDLKEKNVHAKEIIINNTQNPVIVTD